nr:hypothetical protein [Tanacetum cinerariifolium]
MQTDLAIARQLVAAVRELQANINTRQALIDDTKTNLKDNKIATILFFIEMQDKELACVRDLLVKIDEVLRRIANLALQGCSGSGYRLFSLVLRLVAGRGWEKTCIAIWAGK